jgi:hypothetical protein
MKLDRPYAEEGQAEPILAGGIPFRRRGLQRDEWHPTPRASARGYSLSFGFGSILKIDDLDSDAEHHLGVLVYLGSSASPRLRAVVVPGREDDALFVSRRMVTRAESYMHALIEATSGSFYSATIDRHPGDFRIFSFEDELNRFWKPTSEPKGEESLEVVAEGQPAQEMVRNPAKSSTAHAALRQWVAISNTLKLMALILWSSIRHPLTESVIDFDNVRVSDNPIRDKG